MLLINWSNMTRATPQSDPHANDLLVPLTDIAHLFTAPPISPMSDSPTELLGLSGVDYLLSLLYLKPRKHTDQKRLVLLLENPPPAPDGPSILADQTTRALHRYAEARIDQLSLELHNTYRDGWRVLGISSIVLAICIALSTLFASDYTAGLRPVLRTTLEYGFEIVGWVVMWSPIDILVFAPRPLRFRIRALQTLASATIIIQAEVQNEKA